MIAADSQNARSILVYQNNLDKISKIAPNAILGLSGPNSDLVSFSEYVTKNLTLYHLSNEGSPLSTHSIANFCRGELATALRKGPFQVQTVLGGWDKTKSKPNQPVVEDDEGAGSLYFLDYMGSMQKVPYALQVRKRQATSCKTRQSYTCARLNPSLPPPLFTPPSPLLAPRLCCSRRPPFARTAFVLFTPPPPFARTAFVVS